MSSETGLKVGRLAGLSDGSCGMEVRGGFTARVVGGSPLVAEGMPGERAI